MMTFDSSEVEKGLLDVTKKLTGRQSEVAVFQGLAALKKDADTVPPKTPHLEGQLRGDYKITAKKNLASWQTVGELTFNMPYAARWHETTADINWSESGVGPKYVEKKMDMFRGKYLKIMGMIMERVIR